MPDCEDLKEKKEIEEMARVICGFTHSEGKCDCVNDCKNKKNQCSAYCDCKALYNAGYAKFDRAEWVKREDFDSVIENAKITKQQAVKEFAEKLRDKLGYCDEDDDMMHYIFYQKDLDDLLKEYGVDNGNTI